MTTFFNPNLHEQISVTWEKLKELQCAFESLNALANTSCLDRNSIQESCHQNDIEAKNKNIPNNKLGWNPATGAVQKMPSSYCDSSRYSESEFLTIIIERLGYTYVEIGQFVDDLDAEFVGFKEWLKDSFGKVGTIFKLHPDIFIVSEGNVCMKMPETVNAITDSIHEANNPGTAFSEDQVIHLCLGNMPDGYDYVEIGPFVSNLERENPGLGFWVAKTYKNMRMFFKSCPEFFSVIGKNVSRRIKNEDIDVPPAASESSNEMQQQARDPNPLGLSATHAYCYSQLKAISNIAKELLCSGQGLFIPNLIFENILRISDMKMWQKLSKRKIHCTDLPVLYPCTFIERSKCIGLAENDSKIPSTSINSYEAAKDKCEKAFNEINELNLHIHNVILYEEFLDYISASHTCLDVWVKRTFSDVKEFYGTVLERNIVYSEIIEKRNQAVSGSCSGVLSGSSFPSILILSEQAVIHALSVLYTSLNNYQETRVAGVNYIGFQLFMKNADANVRRWLRYHYASVENFFQSFPHIFCTNKHGVGCLFANDCSKTRNTNFRTGDVTLSNTAVATVCEAELLSLKAVGLLKQHVPVGMFMQHLAANHENISNYITSRYKKPYCFFKLFPERFSVVNNSFLILKAHSFDDSSSVINCTDHFSGVEKSKVVNIPGDNSPNEYRLFHQVKQLLLQKNGN